MPLRQALQNRQPHTARMAADTDEKRTSAAPSVLRRQASIWEVHWNHDGPSRKQCSKIHGRAQPCPSPWQPSRATQQHKRTSPCVESSCATLHRCEWKSNLLPCGPYVQAVGDAHNIHPLLLFSMQPCARQGQGKASALQPAMRSRKYKVGASRRSRLNAAVHVLLYMTHIVATQRCVLCATQQNRAPFQSMCRSHPAGPRPTANVRGARRPCMGGAYGQHMGAARRATPTAAMIWVRHMGNRRPLHAASSPPLPPVSPDGICPLARHDAQQHSNQVHPHQIERSLPHIAAPGSSSNRQGPSCGVPPCCPMS